MYRRLLTVGSLLICVTNAGCARRAADPQPAIVCDTAAATVPGAERRRETLYAVADLGYAAPDTARAYARFLLEALGSEFRWPSPAALAVWGAPDSLDKDLAVPVLAAEAVVGVRPDGQVDRVALTQTSLVAAIDAAFVSALRKAAVSDETPKPSWLGIDKEISVWVALTFSPGPDLAPSTRRSAPTDSMLPPRRTVTHPLLTLQLPVARFSSHAEAVPNTGHFPRYPDHLARARVGGKVRLQFVVGGEGRIVPGTVRVAGGSDRGFVEAVLAAADRMKFLPGRIGGCPVPVLVEQAFEFQIPD